MIHHHELKNWHDNATEMLTQQPLRGHTTLDLDSEKPVLSVSFPILNERQRWIDHIRSTCPDPNLQITFDVVRKVGQNKLPMPTSIKNIIPIYSTKGGVGKSTITHEIAKTLASYGYQVGILDADIYGPNQADLFNDSAAPEVVDNLFQPRETNGIYWMSMGLLNEGKPVIWRGPMASRAFKQLLEQTAWPELDFLLIDMPPGTGDIQLTLMKEMSICSSIIITTPDQLAYQDALKGMSMMAKLDIHIGGWINNMTSITCSSCQTQHPLHQATTPPELEAIASSHQLPFFIPPKPCFSQELSPFLSKFFVDFAKLSHFRGRKIPQIVVK